MRKKKLEGVALNWLNNSSSAKDSLSDDLAAWGVLPEQIKTIAGQIKENTFELWSHNVEAWNAFMIICNQFNYSSAGTLIGLNYSAIKDGFEMAGYKMTPKTFDKLQVIDSAVIKQVNKSG